LVDRLTHYFLSYKQFPGDAPRRVEIAEVYDRAEAGEEFMRSLRDYQQSSAIRTAHSQLRKLISSEE